MPNVSSFVVNRSFVSFNRQMVRLDRAAKLSGLHSPINPLLLLIDGTVRPHHLSKTPSLGIQFRLSRRQNGLGGYQFPGELSNELIDYPSLLLCQWQQ